MLTEKQKMLAGQYYDAFDGELLKARKKAHKACRSFNARIDNNQKARGLLYDIFARADQSTYIESPFFCDYGFNISLGENTYLNTGVVILDCAKVDIGRDVKIGPNVQIYTATHAIDAEERVNGGEFAKPVVIEDKVWIGGNCTLLPGITIGEGAVVGAGSVVTKNVGAHSVVAGNPARVIKK